MQRAAIAITVGAWLAAGREAELERYEYRRLVMGTEARIVLYAPDEERARRAAEGAFERMLELEERLSDWREDSELSRLGRAASGSAVEASEDLLRVLEVALSVARESDGAFDPTVGPLVALWREARRTGRPPSEEAVREGRARVGWRKVELDRAAGTVRLDAAGMRLDLGGVAKGDALDEAFEVLEREGTPRALLDLGGDLVAGDPPPGERGWRIEARCGPERGPDLELARLAVATSGNVEQTAVLEGRRVGHLIDPETGRGTSHEGCAGVIAPRGALADALATAASLLGPVRARALVARFPGARLVEGTMRER